MKEPPHSRNLADLDPQYKQRFLDYLAHLRATFPQFDIIVTETGRSDERQAYLRAKGASRTNRSHHQDGRAIDIALLRKATNQLDWNERTFINVYRVADPRDYGLTSGGHLWGWDYAHLQPVELQGRGENV